MMFWELFDGNDPAENRGIGEQKEAMVLVTR
jgi:hypothetical protein